MPSNLPWSQCQQSGTQSTAGGRTCKLLSAARGHSIKCAAKAGLATTYLRSSGSTGRKAAAAAATAAAAAAQGMVEGMHWQQLLPKYVTSCEQLIYGYVCLSWPRHIQACCYTLGSPDCCTACSTAARAAAGQFDGCVRLAKQQLLATLLCLQIQRHCL